MKKPKVAFVCVHNSCRSQIAEALGKHFSSNIFESYSAGTETKPQINQDAVRLSRPRQHRHLKRKNSILFLVFLDFPHFFIHSGWQDTLF